MTLSRNPHTASLPICFIFLFLLFFPTTGRATTWAEAKLTDPIGGGECISHDVVSYGSYIYNWPSKYDMVFWPYTDQNFISYCPDSGYAAFNGDFAKLTDADKARLSDWLKANRKKETTHPQDLQSLDWLERLYTQRGMDDEFWSFFFRLRAYSFAEEGDQAKSLAYVRKAYPLIEKSLSKDLKESELLSAYYLMGEYNRRLGDKKKAEEYFAKAKTAEYTDEDGNKKIGHPYILDLIEESQTVMNNPSQRPVPVQRQSGRQDNNRQKQSCSSQIKSSLANMALAQEAYFVDNDKYATTIDQLEGADKFVDKDVILKLLKVENDYFVAEGSHKNCDDDKDGKPDKYMWDSDNGGLQE
ncbi:MAG: DUF2225 domain-containing protein [Nitrospinota bacterium]|nr:DUF2225 domain-containing protein [Nitrospinota bacterium]